MSGRVKKCKKCGTYNSADTVCECWGTPKGSKLVSDSDPYFDIPVLPEFTYEDLKAHREKAQQLQTLPTDSAARKEYPLYRGCLQYFPAALAGVSRISKLGNDKHNPGQEMHHARGKSTDHGDCILRHLLDLSELLARYGKKPQSDTVQQIKDESSSLAWRALALSQEIHERFGAPQAPGAKD